LEWDPKGRRQLSELRAALDADGEFGVGDGGDGAETSPRPPGTPLIAAVCRPRGWGRFRMPRGLTSLNTDPPYPCQCACDVEMGSPRAAPSLVLSGTPGKGSVTCCGGVSVDELAGRFASQIPWSRLPPLKAPRRTEVLDAALDRLMAWKKPRGGTAGRPTGRRPPVLARQRSLV